MTKGRRVTLDTKIGRLMHARNIRAYQLAGACDFSTRILSDYLSQRKPISPRNLEALCKFFNCPPEDIVEDHWFMEKGKLRAETDPVFTDAPHVTPIGLDELRKKHKAEMR